MMIALVEPCEKYLQSYIEAYDEYKQNDVQTYAFDDAKAKALGITNALITCDDDNYGSAKVMENNGFELQDKVQNRRKNIVRYSAFSGRISIH